MTENLVLTLAVGSKYEEMAKLTHPTLKKYAERIGADFICISEANTTTPHWEKFNQIYTLLNKYKRIFYLDTDIIIRDDCPNVFDLIPKEKLSLFDEMPYTNQRNLSLIESCKDYGIILKNWNGKYYNTGVMVVSRLHKELFKKPEKEIFNFYEQGYFNANLAKILESVGNELSVQELPYWFNRMTCMDNYTGEERFASYIIHYAGYPNLNFVLDLIQKDIYNWNTSSKNGGYHYKRHILINVQGGLGDQICVEPVIRFMQKHVYKEDDITVVTHFPRIFKHIKDIKLFAHGEFKREQDVPYYHICSLPGPETLMWQYISNLMCHTVDFSSMALLRRILPNEDKQVKIEVNLDDIKKIIEVVGIRNLNDLILIHPGRHWQSKTFPIQWWQDVVDGLAEEKLPICIIGKDETTRGVLDIKIPEGVLDTRNLLDLDSLIALIAQAKILVSNDSAPIHIAGAFDNHIILIPTCKHPDHILPYRNGTQSYKTTALYKDLACYEFDSRPTSIYGVLGDKLKRDYSFYLPEPKLIVDKIKEIYRR